MLVRRLPHFREHAPPQFIAVVARDRVDDSMADTAQTVENVTSEEVPAGAIGLGTPVDDQLVQVSKPRAAERLHLVEKRKEEKKTDC